ncbi:MAG: hypothetical protein JSR80_02185 [Verrucomicrobia bacterium]|nr:hypothetical protein [Verrucomicrobiota bacterium]
MDNVVNNKKMFIFDEILKMSLEKKFSDAENSPCKKEDKKNQMIQQAKKVLEDHYVVSEKAMTSGCEALKEKRFLELDPLVGDTACQTRAPEIPAIYRRYLKEGDLSPSDKKFVGLCYFLTQSCEEDKERKLRRTNHKRIAQIYKVSTKVTDQIVCSAQRMLATLSIEVIEKVAQGLQSDPLTKEVLQEKCRRFDTFQRPLLPAYFTVVAALKGEKEAGRPLQLIVEGPVGKKVYIFPEEKPPIDVMVTVEGTTKYGTWELFEEGMKTYGFEEMIFTCCAQHVQYGSSMVKDQTIPIENAMEEVSLKSQKALLIGTHQKNEQFFMAKHIRAMSFEGEKK